MMQSNIRQTFPISLCFLLWLTFPGHRVSAQIENAGNQPDILSGVSIEQRLDESIPLDLTFRNEAGRELQLSEYFGNKPVILTLVYYECPMLCTMILNGVLESLNTLKFDVGKEFNVVTVSFDPRETAELAARKKYAYVQKYDRPGAEDGWHFLTGDERSIKRLTEAVGFNYKFDPKSNQFVHASGIMIATPNGKLSRYFYGVEYSVRDLKLGLMEASDDKIGSPVDQLQLYCYHYDPTTGKYGVVIMKVIRIAGIVTVALLVSFMLVMFRRDKKSKTVFRKLESLN